MAIVIPEYPAAWITLIIVTVLLMIAVGGLLTLHLRVKSTKRSEINKINGIIIDKSKGLDLLVLKIDGRHTSGTSLTVSKWEPKEVITVHKQFTLYVDEEEHSSKLINQEAKPDADRSTSGELPQFGTERVEKDSEQYTIVKTNYFGYIGDSIYQTVNAASAGVEYKSEQPKQDESIDPADFPNRHLTFSEIEGDVSSPHLFSQSGRKNDWRPVDSPAPKVRKGLSPISERDEVFQFESSHYNKKESSEDLKKNGFDSVKEDVQQVVYGDPNSKSKLAFFEKVKLMKQKAGTPMSNYDTLGAPQDSQGSNVLGIFEVNRNQ